MLRVDSGNFSDNPTPAGEIKTRALVEAMGRLGYAAVNVGDRDLALGYDGFLDRVEGAKFPFVSANIVRQDTGEPVFDPYVIVKAQAPKGKKRVRVGILGATRFNPLFLKAGPEGANLVIARPEEELLRYIAPVREKVDYVVLLAALHKDEAKRIVRRVPGIDFVVGAYGGIITSNEDKEGATWLLYAGNQGKRVGETRVYTDGTGKIVSAETYMYMLSRRFPSDPRMQSFVNTAAERAAAGSKGAATAGGRPAPAAR